MDGTPQSLEGTRARLANPLRNVRCVSRRADRTPAWYTGRRAGLIAGCQSSAVPRSKPHRDWWPTPALRLGSDDRDARQLATAKRRGIRRPWAVLRRLSALLRLGPIPVGRSRDGRLRALLAANASTHRSGGSFPAPTGRGLSRVVFECDIDAPLIHEPSYCPIRGPIAIRSRASCPRGRPDAPQS